MQKKILRTTALLLCFCILLLAVPNTFARDGKKGSRFESSKSRFLFLNTGDILANVLFFLGPHIDHQTDTTGTPPVKNVKKSTKKLTGGMSKSHASTGD
jgi:hypothetical protein